MSPTPVSSWWDLPTTLSLSSFRIFSIHFHLSKRQVAVDSLQISLVQKQAQKRKKRIQGQMLFQLDLKHMPRSGMCDHICAAHVSLGIRKDPERDPVRKQEHSRLVSAVCSQNVESQKTSRIGNQRTLTRSEVLGQRQEATGSLHSCNCCYLC